MFDDSVSDFYNKNVVTFPDDYFTVFREVLEKYNFTVDESSPEFQQVAVDPEMLGRIFESLLGEMQTKAGDSLRSATGAFYTPREIVSYMCERSLLEYLKTRIQDSPDRDRRLEEIIKLSESIFRDQDQNKRRDWKPYQQPILDALKTVAIFDPAVGSGAFPMGMLHLLVKVYTRLDSKYERNLSKLKREILSRSLYGCDISTTAIEISRLRAWLSIIVDIPKGDDIEALPNLDFKFVCANTLIPLEKSIQQTLDPKSSPDLKNQLIDIRDEYFKTGKKKEKERLRKKYNEITQASLFGETKAEQQLKSYKPFDIGSSSEFYDPELMHGVQLFDVVIGNPPYVKEDVSREAFLKLKSSKYYQGKMDLWYFFGCFGLDVIREQGVVCYIAPNNWVSNDGATKLRKKIIEDSEILEFVDFGDCKVFKSAGIQTMIFLLKKNDKSFEFSTKYSKLLSKTISNEELIDFLSKKESTNFLMYELKIRRRDLMLNNITFTEDVNSKLLNKITKESDFSLNKEEVLSGIDVSQDFVNKEHKNFLGESFEIGDGIFVISNEEKETLNLSKKEELLLKPFYTTKELVKYFGSDKNRYWIIYTDSNFKNHNSMIEYPNLKKHLDQYQEIITSENKPYGLNRARNESIISKRKCPDSPVFTYTNFDTYFNRTFLQIITKRINLKYLVAVLNSSVVSFWLKYKGKMQGSNYQIDKGPLLGLPVKKVSESEQGKYIELVDQILCLKKENKDADTKNLELQIDQLVYKLYDLTQEEIEIIENSTKK